MLAYLIAGHHPGLTNGEDGDAPQSSLKERLQKPVELGSYGESLPVEVTGYRPAAPLPRYALQSGQSLSFFLRVLFSCLTDADFLATESFMNRAQLKSRSHRRPSLAEMENALGENLEELISHAVHTEVNCRRSEILAACRAAAERAPGLFSLTVPTGGGKTLSSLAFALKHARLYNLRRIIYVIPFTSIIEQNVAVFRSALSSLGPDVVIENHSNLDPDDPLRSTTMSRLSAENWDGRLIVTTNVQFFESLHANRTSRSRKLHRIARSVVILDEAQTLPIEITTTCPRRQPRAGGESDRRPRSVSTTASGCSSPSLERLVDPSQLVALRSRLLKILNPETDSLRIHHLGHDWDHRVEHHGTKASFDPQGPLIV